MIPLERAIEIDQNVESKVAVEKGREKREISMDSLTTRDSDAQKNQSSQAGANRQRRVGSKETN